MPMRDLGQPDYLTLENLLRQLMTQYLVAMTAMLLGLPWHSSQNRGKVGCVVFGLVPLTSSTGLFKKEFTTYSKGGRTSLCSPS